MPYTFSHPLAVVPFRRWCPNWFNFAALVIGSTSPDFGMFIGQYDEAGFAHSMPGTFAVCLPTGLLALGIFYLLRQPLCYILPQPHRAALTPLALARPPLSVRGLFIAAISVLIGAWIHTIWDSFTHRYGWAVKRIEFLRTPLFSLGGKEFFTSSILQYSCSVIATAALILLYMLWLRRQPSAAQTETRDSSDRWRYCLLGAVAFLTFAIAITAAFWQTSQSDGGSPIHAFVFNLAVYSISAFFPLLVVFAIVAFAFRKRVADSAAQE